jgi:hypothetical protein
MSIFDLGPFRRELRIQQEAFETKLAQGRIPRELAIHRRMIERMQDDLIAGEKALKVYIQPDPHVPGSPEFRWRVAMEMTASRDIIPYERDRARYERVVKEFDDYANQLRGNVQKAYKFLHDTSLSREVWVVRHNAPTKMVMEKIADALIEWRESHEPDDDFFYVPAKVAILRLLEEDRPDLGVMLRLALSLPKDIETTVLEVKERPTWIQVVSIAIGFIPIIGSAIEAYEAYRGKDIFGYALSDVERAIIGASIFLPVAGRLIKSGRAMYTADRRARLYGNDATRWSQSLAHGERLSADAVGLSRLKAVNEAVVAGRKVTKKAATDLTDTFKALGLDSAGKILSPAAVDSKLIAAFAAVSAKFPKLKNLDAYAIERIAARGANLDHVKGQLLEELLEDHIVKLLRDRYGKRALGLEKIKGTFQFIPGHLIRDFDGLLLTDGIIVRQVKDQLQIVAVFEAKSGKASARELSAKSKSVKELTSEERAEYLFDAQSTLKDLQERARLKGQPPPNITLEEIMKKMKNTEAGGQIRSDVERLSAARPDVRVHLDEKPDSKLTGAGIFINSRELPIELYVGPATTKWFGAVPRDVKGGAIKDALKKAGLKNVEILGLDITQAELKSAAEFIVKTLGAPAKK